MPNANHTSLHNQFRDLKPDEFVVITAASDNHFGESVGMLRSLRHTNYSGPVYFYLLSDRPMEQHKEKVRRLYMDYTTKLQNFSLHPTVVDYPVPSSETLIAFCWKPRVIAETLKDISKRQGKQVRAFLWADSSTRFHENPLAFASRMLRDGVDFAGRTGVLGMAENTDPRTYKFLNKSSEDYKNFTEIVATHFLANLLMMNSTLQRWYDCALLENCRKCMAPSLEPKKFFGEIKGSGNPNFVVVRQDQSVLGLLLYELQILKQQQNIQLNKQKEYFNIWTCRSASNCSNSINDLNKK